MSAPINLRRARKQRLREAARTAAGARAAAAGETKASRRGRKAEAAQAERRLDQHRRDDPAQE